MQANNCNGRRDP